jgi:hypothetical protein
MAKAKITGDALEVAKLNLAELKEQWQKDYGQQLHDYVPETNDVESYNKLISAVKQASQRNESIAAFKNNVQALGEGVVRLAKTVGILV